MKIINKFDRLEVSVVIAISIVAIIINFITKRN